MQIVIDVKDKEELLSAINNSIIALESIRGQFCFALDVPSAWDVWCKKRYNGDVDVCANVLKERQQILFDIYKQIELSSVNPKEPLTEEDYIELHDRFGDYVEFVVKDMVSGKGERWTKNNPQEPCTDLCKSCDTKGCIFQSGIKREKCDFYTLEKREI